MDQLKKDWEKVLELSKLELTSVSYNTWFVPLKPKQIDEEAKILYIQSPEQLAIEVLKNRYFQILENNVNIAFKGPYRVILQLQTEDDQEIQEKKEEKEINNKILKEEFYFNPRYNFDNFIVGNNNKYAHAVAVAVAENPFEAYNPFFIYGGSGLGKTHLMHAIGHHILEHHPDLKVLYVSSEMFTNELIKCIEKDKARNTKMRAFKNKYRNIDVLLIDDIQFIEGKESTQEEFFHTFNTLYDLNKQIIISSDRAPNKLTKLDERLRSRFQWNIIADIQPPDYETRVAILRKKAELETVELNDDAMQVITMIAEKIKFNIRELEGALTRIISFSNLMNEPVTVKFARKILNDLFSSSDFNITCETIKKIVCKHFNIKTADIESKKRTSNLAYPRQIAMYLCRVNTETSLPKIGEAFGGRDHTTVLYAIEKIESELKTNKSTSELIETLTREINDN